MSRFRPEKRVEKPPEEYPPSQPAVNVVPMSADEYARLRRQKILKWGSAGAIGGIILFAFLYRSSMPSAALNNYLDAKKLFESGNYPDALVAIEPATHDRTRRIQADQLRAAIYRAMYQPQDAVPDLTRAIKLQQNNPENYRLRAQTYIEMNDPASALNDFTKLIELENSAAAYNSRGLCYLKLKEPQKAIEDFTKSIERGPTVECYLQRGLAWATTGDHHKAIADFDRAIEMRPSLSAIYRARANSKQQLGDVAGAERDRETALTMERPAMPDVKPVESPKS